MLEQNWRPLGVLAGLTGLAGLSGLLLIRLWAVLGGLVHGKVLLLAAVLLAAGCMLAVWRFRLGELLLPALDRKTVLIGAAAFLLGAGLDTSYALFQPAGLLVDTLPFHLLCALGSGLVLALIVLCLYRAALDFGPLRWNAGRTLLILALAANLVTALYCARSATVYYWDNAIYWNSSTLLAQQPLDLAQVRLVLESVITQEYNYLLAWPISLVMRVLGAGRYVYLFSLVNLYLLPALWGLCVLGRRLRGGGGLLFLFTPVLLYAALLGYVDVAAAGAAIWAVVLYADAGRPPVARGVLAGALLVLTFLLRRYFFFFAATFGIGALAALAVRRTEWKAFLSLFGSAALCSLYFAQHFLVEQVLNARYSDLYSAYDQGRLADLTNFARYFGVVMLAAALCAGVFLLLRRPERRYGAVHCLVQLAACFLLFTRVQTHGMQHLLLYVPSLCWLLAEGTAELSPAKPKQEGKRTRSAQRKGWKALRPAVLCAWVLALCTTVSAYLPGLDPSPLPFFTYTPAARSDLGQLIALRLYMDGLSAQEPKTAAIAASSFTLNTSLYNSILRSANIPEAPGPKTEILYMADVDKRDGFSWNVLTADYLVVGDPVQTHLGEENQQVVAYLAHAVLEGTGVGTAYEPLEISFPLQKDTTARIYRRTRPVRPEEYQEISDYLTGLYPDYAERYQFPSWLFS